MKNYIEEIIFWDEIKRSQYAIKSTEDYPCEEKKNNF